MNREGGLSLQVPSLVGRTDLAPVSYRSMSGVKTTWTTCSAFVYPLCFCLFPLSPFICTVVLDLLSWPLPLDRSILVSV